MTAIIVKVNFIIQMKKTYFKKKKLWKHKQGHWRQRNVNDTRVHWTAKAGKHNKKNQLWHLCDQESENMH